MSIPVAKFHMDHQQPITTVRSRPPLEINGHRPSPLKLNQSSHQIQKPKHQKPIIIYVHSPKIIHTQATDFMALVQNLTGNRPIKNSLKFNKKNDQSLSLIGQSNSNSDKESTRRVCLSNSPILKPPKQPNFADVPLFTPTSTDQFFCSPKAFFRFSPWASPTSVEGSLSPTVLKLFKDLPDY